MKKFIIDRFEGNYAVCETENKKMINIPKTELPDGIEEGDSLYLDENGKYFIDKVEINSQKERIRKKMDNLWE